MLPEAAGGVAFHRSARGANFVVSPCGLQASRRNAGATFNNAVGFSAEPLGRDVAGDRSYTVRVLSTVNQWAGSCTLGVTRRCPAEWPKPLPNYMDCGSGSECWLITDCEALDCCLW